MKKISEELEKEILKAYLEDKKSTTEIAGLIGYSSTLISKVVKRNGIKPRNISESKKGVKRDSKLPVDDIIKMYVEEKKSSCEISKIIGFSEVSIIKSLKNSGIKIRKKRIKKYNPLAEKIKELYLSGKSTDQVRIETNLSYGVVRRILVDFGIIRKENRGKGSKGKKGSLESLNKAFTKKYGISYDEYLETLPEFKKYRKKVESITRKQPIHDLENYEKRGKAGEEGVYHLDHKYSIREGFDNGVDPKIVGNIHNLEFIRWEENMTKGRKSSITLKSLIKKIRSKNGNL